jgi:hypothetical protein
MADAIAVLADGRIEVPLAEDNCRFGGGVAISAEGVDVLTSLDC